jgi:hypothetical protein
MCDADPMDTVLDEPVADDQYLYVATHDWSSAHVGTRWRDYRYRGESWRRDWIPGDRRRDWLAEREPTGRRVWLSGSEKRAVAAGFAEFVRDRPADSRRVPGGGFFGADGWWQVPTADFLAALPRDPDELYRRLCTDSPAERRGYVGPLVYGVDVLRTGLVPADLRAALYQALRLLPGLTVVADTVNPDGAPAIALCLDHTPWRTEVFVDPVTGHYIGERQTCVARVRDCRAGWVLRSAAVTRAVVERIGVRRGGDTTG